MKPKQKARELFEKMYNKIQPDELGKDQESAKQCALIAINEMLKIDSQILKNINYLKDIKNEIEKL